MHQLDIEAEAEEDTTMHGIWLEEAGTIHIQRTDTATVATDIEAITTIIITATISTIHQSPPLISATTLVSTATSQDIAQQHAGTIPATATATVTVTAIAAATITIIIPEAD